MFWFELFRLEKINRLIFLCESEKFLLLSILREPGSLIVILGSYCRPEIGSTFFIQLTEGEGEPEASQGSRARVLIGRVWLAGPTLMIGGGSSAMAVTSRYALVEIDPATEKAEQTKKPSSSILTPGDRHED